MKSGPDPNWMRDPNNIDPVAVQRMVDDFSGCRRFTSKLERLAAFRILESRGHYTDIEMARRIGVSERTIERYRATLKQETA